MVRKQRSKTPGGFLKRNADSSESSIIQRIASPLGRFQAAFQKNEDFSKSEKSESMISESSVEPENTETEEIMVNLRGKPRKRKHRPVSALISRGTLKQFDTKREEFALDDRFQSEFQEDSVVEGAPNRKIRPKKFRKVMS